MRVLGARPAVPMVALTTLAVTAQLYVVIGVDALDDTPPGLPPLAQNCNPVPVEETTWLHYPRIGKASSTAVSKYLVLNKPGDAMFVDFVRDFNNPGAKELINAAECWFGATNCTQFGDAAATEVLESARWGSCGWIMQNGVDGPQADQGFNAVSTCIKSNRWGVHPVVTAFHMFDIDWESFNARHPLMSTRLPTLIQVLRNGTDRHDHAARRVHHIASLDIASQRSTSHDMACYHIVLRK